MSKRKSSGSELRQPRPPSPDATKSSIGEWPEFSSSSAASSVSYSSKMPSAEDSVQRSWNAAETKAMPLVGCPRCFMYVMLSEVDPKCPKCKSTEFLEFFKDENFKTNK